MRYANLAFEDDGDQLRALSPIYLQFPTHTNPWEDQGF